MKTRIRKVVSLLCALALTASCFTASTVAFAADAVNVATVANGVTVMADPASEAITDHGPELVIDGDQTTYWQSHSAGDKTRTTWIGLDLGKTYSLTEIIMIWGEPRPNTNADGNGTGIQVSADGQEWIPVTATVVRGKNQHGATDGRYGYKFTLSAAAETRYVRLYCGRYQNEGNNGKNAYLMLYDFQVFGTEVEGGEGGESPVLYDTAKLNEAVDYIEGSYGPGTDNSYGYNTTAWNTMLTYREQAAAALSAGLEGAEEGTVGDYTNDSLNALADNLMAAGAALSMDSNPYVGGNVLQNGILLHNPEKLAANPSKDINYRSLTDGEKTKVGLGQNCWQPSGTARSQYVFIKLVAPADIREFAVFAEQAAEEYSFAYVTGDVSGLTTYAEMDALSWQDMTVTREYSVGQFTEATAYQFYSCDETAVGVTAIKVTCTKGVSGLCKLREVEAYCDSEGANTTMDTPFSIDSEDGTMKFIGIAVDKKDVASKKITVTYTVNGTEYADDVRTVNTAYAAVNLGGTMISAETVGGHAGDYITGILFTNVPAGAVVTAAFAME